MAITPLAAAAAQIAPVASSASPAASAETTGSAGFADSLESMLRAVESTGTEANDAVSRMLAGNGDVHTALIAMQQADTTFQLTVQVRNKLVQAYQDVMRMPI
jgi:flagellar hook-basal body complex protein FliE